MIHGRQAALNCVENAAFAAALAVASLADWPPVPTPAVGMYGLWLVVLIKFVTPPLLSVPIHVSRAEPVSRDDWRRRQIARNGARSLIMTCAVKRRVFVGNRIAGNLMFRRRQRTLQHRPKAPNLPWPSDRLGAQSLAGCSGTTCADQGAGGKSVNAD